MLTDEEYSLPRAHIRQASMFSDMLIVQNEDGTTDIVKCRYANNVENVDRETLDWYIEEHSRIRTRSKNEKHMV